MIDVNPFAGDAPPGTREHARRVGYARGLDAVRPEVPPEVGVAFRPDFNAAFLEGLAERQRIEQEEFAAKVESWRQWADDNHGRILAGFGRQAS